MRLLLATSNRELLDAYSELLQSAGNDVKIAFDATQLINNVETDALDLIILDSAISKKHLGGIMDHLNSTGIPSIMMIYGKPTTSLLLSPYLPSSYISFPFGPEDLFRKIEKIMNNKDRVTVEYDSGKLEFSDFKIKDTRFTADEIDVLRIDNKYSDNPDKELMYMTSINLKLKQSHQNVSLKFIPSEGLKLVATNE